MLTQAPPSATPPPPAGQPADDMSGRAHRQLIGYFGLALPVLLVLIAALRPDSADRWGIRDSVSAYYYSGAVAIFVGLLVALALFLLTYRGYKNQYQWADRAAAVIAGLAAFGVAFFPTGAPDGTPPPQWWTPSTGVLHYSSAVILFTMFAVFSLWLFRLPPGGEPPPAGHRWRHRVYLLCGLVIVASMVWAGIAGRNRQPIFVPESVALIAFALSWLVKGQAHKTIAETARSIARK